jgi:hypothetical protein
LLDRMFGSLQGSILVLRDRGGARGRDAQGRARASAGI